MARGGHLRRLAAAGGAVLVLCILLFLLHRPILAGIGGLLVVEDSLPASADLLFLLNGGVDSRPFRAAELFRAGRAPRIVIAQSERLPTQTMGLLPNSTDVSTAVLRRLGVPADAITVLSYGEGTTSTGDEARALRAFLTDVPARRVIVVTSEYHSRRTRWLLRRELDGLPVVLHVATARERFGPSDWWRSEAGLIAYFEEFVKLGRFLLTRN